MAVLLRTGSGIQFGVREPVPVALCQDEAAIRAVLVHEFCHCFFDYTRAWDLIDSGQPPSILDHYRATDSAADAGRLAPPGNWFSESDARTLILQQDAKLAKFNEPYVRAQQYLATSVPDRSRNFTGVIAAPGDVIKHIRYLRGRPAGARQ
jgi:hypothetical protein